MDCREVLKHGALLASTAVAVAKPPWSARQLTWRRPRPGRRRGPQQVRFFPGFKPFTVKTTGAVINGVIGGTGPPSASARRAAKPRHVERVAPKMAASRTVVVPDLRGYGDSSKPPDGESHVNYSKRAMALDQVEVMK